MDTAQVASLRHWFEIALDTSVMLDSNDNIGGAMFVPVNSIDTLHSHQAEAAKQLDNLDEASLKWNNWVQMSSQIWSLMVALWGRVEEVAGVGGGGQGQEGHGDRGPGQECGGRSCCKLVR